MATQKTKPEVDRAALIEAAIKAGHVEVLTEGNTVKVTVEGQKDPIVEPYRRLKALNLKGALALSAQDEEELVDHVNYSYDLGARASVRQRVLGRFEDPAKAFEKTVKTLMGLGLSEDLARTQAKIAQDLAAKQAKK